MNSPKSEEEIFYEALEVPFDQRAEFLHSACKGNPELLASIQGLLQLHDTEEDFLATPAIGISSNDVDEKSGDRIGAYVLENIVGEGGFGVVWQAQQIKPIQRQVALKIVKLGMDSQNIIDRFDDERQTLALMNHPNIATVLDAGVTQGGRPFFAMEFVQGNSIDRFCSEKNLSIAERLKIFVTVCRAVQHAHQKGIVHRDLKPSNILVSSNDDQMVPKVIDFGIATAVASEHPTNASIRSELSMAGTPQYMSPEHWKNETDIDTRSDIYSLGIVLYRLLAGSLPETDHQKGPVEFSGFANKLAAKHRDLDFITRKAMSRQREDRYQSASEMAMDIERFLNGQAVLAHPGGTWYSYRKFVNRNKIAVGSGVLTVLALLAGMFASTLGMLYANEQRDIADQQKKVAQDNEKEAIRLKEIAESEARKLRVVANVLRNVLPEAQPFRGMKSGFQIRQHLDDLIDSVDTLSNEPELEADLRITTARVYENLSRHGRARLQYSKSYEIRKEHLGEQHPKTLLSLAGAAACNIELGRLAAADRMIQEVLNKSEGRAPRTHINALRTLRKIRNEQERYEEAFEIAQQCRELAKRVYKNEIFGRIHVANEYSMSAMKIGLKDEAEQVVRESLLVLERDHPERKFVIANTKHRLAEVLMESEKYAEAKQLAAEFVDMQELTLGENDVYVIRGLALLSEIHRRDKEMEIAEQFAIDAVERANTHEETQIKIRRTAHRQLAKVLEALDLEKAINAWETANELSWQFLGGDVAVAKDLLRQASLLEQQQDWNASATRVRRAIDIMEKRTGTQELLRNAYHFYAVLLEELGQKELANEFFDKATKYDSNGK